jgi:hypothetical protein
MDNASQHTSALSRDLLDILNLSYMYTIPYHYETNAVEYLFNVVKSQVKKKLIYTK